MRKKTGQFVFVYFLYFLFRFIRSASVSDSNSLRDQRIGMKRRQKFMVDGFLLDLNISRLDGEEARAWRNYPTLKTWLYRSNFILFSFHSLQRFGMSGITHSKIEGSPSGLYYVNVLGNVRILGVKYFLYGFNLFRKSKNCWEIDEGFSFWRTLSILWPSWFTTNGAMGELLIPVRSNF